LQFPWIFRRKKQLEFLLFAQGECRINLLGENVIFLKELSLLFTTRFFQIFYFSPLIVDLLF